MNSHSRRRLGPQDWPDSFSVAALLRQSSC
jgi:hypothetical protein